MSGVLIQSSQAGVPVITANYGLIDHNRSKKSLGLRWDDVLVTSSPKQRFNWEKLVSTVDAIRGSSQLAEFAEEHSPKKFGFNVINEMAEVIVERCANESI
jgi:hypothetical protein